MNILKKDDVRKEFFELTRTQNFSIDEAIDKLFKKVTSKDYLLMGFNGVYVYMGIYKQVHESSAFWSPASEVFVSEEDQTAEYKLFYELDTGLSKYVDIGDELNRFERDNTIVYIPNVRNYEDKTTFEQDFEKLRKAYLKELCIINEKTAVELITNEEYIKRLFSIENYLKENNISSVFYQAFYDAALCNSKNKSNAVVLKKVRNIN